MMKKFFLLFVVLFGLTNFNYAAFPSKESAGQVYESSQKNNFDIYNSNLNNILDNDNFNLNQNISNDSPLVKIWTPKRIIIVIVGFLLSVIGIFLLQAYINSQL